MEYPTPLPLRIFEISTWVMLFLILPAGVLGYFAETSNPGDKLYPLKRDIESVVLRIESVNNSALAFYQIELARVRFKEASTVAIAHNNSQALTDFTQQIVIAEDAVNSLPESASKVKAKQQLLASITDYQEQLVQMHQNATTTNLGTITPTVTQQHNTTTSTSNTNTNSNTNSTWTNNNSSGSNANTYDATQNNGPSPTPTPIALHISESSNIPPSVPTATSYPTPTFVPTNTPSPQGNGSTTSGQQDQTQAIQNAQNQLELARLKLLPTYTLESSTPPPRNWMQQGGVVVFGTDGTWCYSNVGSEGALTHQGMCEDGHSASGNMTLDHGEQNICWPQFSPDDLVIYSCHIWTSGHGGSATQSVGCNNPYLTDSGATVVNTSVNHCSYLIGPGSVCSSGVCTPIATQNEDH